MSTSPQMLMFERNRRAAAKLTIEERFQQFHQNNPVVYELLCKFAREAKDRGVKKWGIKAIFEVVRWHVKVKLQHEGDFKLNNDFTALYARLIMANEPDLADFFDTRERKSE
jgi:hypothetical protein